MRKLQVLFITLAICSIATGQLTQNNIFYETKYLSSLYNRFTKKIVFENNVKQSLTPFVDPAYLKLDSLNKNPFWKELFSPPAGSSIAGFATKTIANLGGVDVTKIADAVSTIMIDRAKQELTIAFFDRFKVFSEKNPEFALLFPKTTYALQNLLSNTYPNMLPVLRTAFIEDLDPDQIPSNLESLLELPKYSTLLQNFPEIKVAVKSLQLIRRLETEKTVNTAEILKDFSAFPEWTGAAGSREFKNMGNTVRFAALFSEAFRSSDTTRIWVTTAELKELLNDDASTIILLGLFYEKIRHDKIQYQFDAAQPNNITAFETIFAQQKDNISLVKTKILQFIQVVTKVDSSFRSMKKKDTLAIKASNEELYNYINISLNAVDYCLGIVKLFDVRFQNEKYMAIAKGANALYKNIYTKKYTAALKEVMEILISIQQLTKENMNGSPDHKTAYSNFSRFIEKSKSYIHFIGNVADASSSDDIKAALENTILPVGSSSIKKNTLCNISIQTYLGAYASISNMSSLSAWSDRFGVLAPIGISWTPGITSLKKGGSVSLFGSLFDLSAIVDYKLKKDSVVSTTGTNTSVVSKEYSIKLGQIFSPGIYVVYGFPWNIPLAFGAGGQYGPGLSKIEAGTSPVLINPYWRWNLFLAVDMPFFTLKNRTRY